MFWDHLGVNLTGKHTLSRHSLVFSQFAFDSTLETFKLSTRAVDA